MIRCKRFGSCMLAMVVLSFVGGASEVDDIVKSWIAEMDAKPVEERVPNWDNIRAMMMRKPPKVGDDAPDFVLKTRDGKDTVRLSQFEGSKPVVLIFASWT